MQKSILRFVMVQQNYTVGAIEQNTAQIIEAILQYQANADVIVFSELSITGYPPEDWLFRADFQVRVEQALQKIQAIVADCYVIVGSFSSKKEGIYNTASVLHQGKIITHYHKQHLPNYGVFDEKRYFEAGNTPCVFSVKGHTVGLLICEDLWQPGAWKKTVEAGAEIIVSLNASPFDRDKSVNREAIIKQRQMTEGRVPCVYVNAVGGQDELIFDGRSFVMNAAGNVTVRAKAFEPDVVQIQMVEDVMPIVNIMNNLDSPEADIYQALVLSTRDYVHKNGFKGVLVGLSGGIDSALTLAIAVDALGAEAVEAVMMPSCYTAAMSYEDAMAEIQVLNVRFRTISIEPMMTLLNKTLQPEKNITQENLQARCRGILLMALSNDTGQLVLTTGNKSELAVGYCTLYGDMCGGFAVLKDVFKTWVYRLAHYRNTLSASSVIPQRVIERAPSAELALNQKDQDSLPAYDVLDEILTQYIEQDKTSDEIINMGIDAMIVHKIIKLLHHNEYKRRQSAPGPKISTRAFGRDWRYPITSY